MLKRLFLRRAIRKVLNEKKISVLTDSTLDQVIVKLKNEPSWWENFYQWVLDNWDEILKIILVVLPLILENEDK